MIIASINMSESLHPLKDQKQEDRYVCREMAKKAYLVQIVIFDDPDASFLPAASFHGDVESQQTGCPSEGEGIWRAKSAAG